MASYSKAVKQTILKRREVPRSSRFCPTYPIDWVKREPLEKLRHLLEGNFKFLLSTTAGTLRRGFHVSYSVSLHLILVFLAHERRPVEPHGTVEEPVHEILWRSIRNLQALPWNIAAPVVRLTKWSLLPRLQLDAPFEVLFQSRTITSVIFPDGEVLFLAFGRILFF